METIDTPVIKTKNPESRWVALDILVGNKIIAEGKEPADVIELANKLGKEFILMFVPKPSDRYIL